MPNVCTKFQGTIDRYSLLEYKDKILVALSGGPDSTALLYLLLAVRDKYDLELFAGHLNHGLRGREADRDEDFCRKLGRNLGIPVYSKKINVTKKGSLEDSARRERYKFLEDTAVKAGADKIAVGHTADDQAETVLMRLIRGAGTKGLAGIPVKRPAGNKGITIIRPLYDLWKEEILRYLKRNRIAYKKDSTNIKPDFFRNRIRRELLPLLTRYNPNVKSTLRRAGNHLAFDDDLIERETDKALKSFRIIPGPEIKVNIIGLLKHHPAVRQRIIRRIISMHYPDIRPDANTVDGILDLCQKNSGNKRLNISKKVLVVKEYNSLIFKKSEKGQKTEKFEGRLILLPLNKKLELPFSNILLESMLEKKIGCLKSYNKRDFCSLKSIFGKKRLNFHIELDYDSLSKPLYVRTRRKGDVFRPIGMKGAKKVKDIFIDEKVPERFRDQIPLLVSGNEICWIAGYRIGERFKITPETKNVLKIRVIKKG